MDGRHRTLVRPPGTLTRDLLFCRTGISPVPPASPCAETEHLSDPVLAEALLTIGSGGELCGARFRLLLRRPRGHRPAAAASEPGRPEGEARAPVARGGDAAHRSRMQKCALGCVPGVLKGRSVVETARTRPFSASVPTARSRRSSRSSARCRRVPSTGPFREPCGPGWGDSEQALERSRWGCVRCDR